MIQAKPFSCAPVQRLSVGITQLNLNMLVIGLDGCGAQRAWRDPQAIGQFVHGGTELTQLGGQVADAVGLVWIDTEGHEGHVLAGAASLVDRGVPIVLELNGRWLAKAECQ